MDHFRALVGESSRLRAQAIETMCERSLLDEEKRGVLVVDDFHNMKTDVSLDDSVPFGQIHYKEVRGEK